MVISPIYSVPVTTRSGRQTTFRIYHGRGIAPAKLAKLHNSLMHAPLEQDGMRVTAEQMEARLEKDRRSVYVGFLDGYELPCSLVNIVRTETPEVPQTSAELTENETFASVLENGARAWFGYWGGIRPEVSRKVFLANIGGKRFNLGQILFLAIKSEALQDPSVQRLIAFTRPRDIRIFLAERVGQINAQQRPGENPVFSIGEGELDLRSEGIFIAESGRRVLGMQEYWDAATPKGRKFDAVWWLHNTVGAQFMPEAVRAYGERNDLRTLCYRTPLNHPLRGQAGFKELPFTL